MNALAKTFFQGLFAFLPVFLTVYAVFAFGEWLNRVSEALLARVVPGLPDVPGLGIATGVLAIFALGVLVSSRLTRWIYALVETPFRHLPVIRDLYGALKQLTALIAPEEGEETGQVVALRHPDLPVSMIGIITRGDGGPLGSAGEDPGTVAIYLPMSYQIGGYTLFVPRSWVTPLDMSVETAMRHTLTGWVQGGEPARAGSARP